MKRISPLSRPSLSSLEFFGNRNEHKKKSSLIFFMLMDAVAWWLLFWRNFFCFVFASLSAPFSVYAPLNLFFFPHQFIRFLMKICSLLARLIRGLLFIANKYKILPLARAFLACLLASLDSTQKNWQN